MSLQNRTATVPPCYFVIFGATGNLAAEKLFPALYALEAAQRLSAALRFVAVGRREWTLAEWQQYLLSTLQDKMKKHVFDSVIAEKLIQRFDYVAGDYAKAATYQTIIDTLAKPHDFPEGASCENIVFYLAITPNDYMTVATH